MKEIDIDSWERKETYAWFSKFANPCYCINMRMDVTDIANYCKKHGKRLFIAICYAVIRVLNGIPGMRYRILDGKVVDIEKGNICYTVATKNGGFVNCRSFADDDFETFHAAADSDIKKAENLAKNIEGDYNNVSIIDDYYLSYVPWIDFLACTQPIPDNLPESNSIPRVCWGRYSEKDGKKELTLNITASHALADGRDLSEAFIRLQEAFCCFDDFIRGNK